MADKSSIDATALAMTLQLRLRLASRPTALQSHDKQFSEADARHLAARFSRTDLLQTAPTDPQWLNFAQQLRNLDKETDRYEDPRLHAMALDLIPFEALHDRADAIQKSSKMCLQACCRQRLMTQSTQIRLSSFKMRSLTRSSYGQKGTSCIG